MKTNLSSNYLRQHIWGGSRRSHLDRRCEKPESLSFAHEGQRIVAVANIDLNILLRAQRGQWIRKCGREAAVEVEKGVICVLVEVDLRYVAIPVWSALTGPEMSGTNAASSLTQLLGATLRNERHGVNRFSLVQLLSQILVQ